MSHRKMSKGARRHLLSLFAPDGYVIVSVLDQTIGFYGGNCWTTKHPEALLYTDKAEAIGIRDDMRALRERSITDRAAHPSGGDDDAWILRCLSDRPFDNDPWVEPVQVAAHFRDRQDTW